MLWPEKWFDCTEEGQQNQMRSSVEFEKMVMACAIDQSMMIPELRIATHKNVQSLILIGSCKSRNASHVRYRAPPNGSPGLLKDIFISESYELTGSYYKISALPFSLLPLIPPSLMHIKELPT